MNFYIYYDSTNGNILAVSNEKDPSIAEHFIQIDLETYENFGSGEYKLNEWAVLPSPVDENIVALVKRVQEIKEFDPDKSIKQIEKVNAIPDNSFVITQNLQKGSWKVTTTLDDKHLIYYNQTDGYSEQQKEIYVIAEDNPTILLDTLIVKFKDLLTKNAYDVNMFNKQVAKRKDISLICSRVDEDYVHVVT